MRPFSTTNRPRLLAGAVVVLALVTAGLASTNATQPSRANLGSPGPAVAGESTVAPGTTLPSASPTPTSSHSVVEKSDGNSSVRIENNSSQSGGSRNTNTSRSTVTINGQTTTVVNGVEQ